MKTLFLNSYLFLSLFLIVSSCSKELVNEKNYEKTAVVAISEGNIGMNSRTQVGGIAPDGHLIMQWSVSDKIGVFGSTVRNVPFTSTNKVPSDKATFYGLKPATDELQKAYYPYVEGDVYSHAIPVEIPEEQLYKDVSSITAYDYKAASQCSINPDGDYQMNFRQMVTMLRLKINLKSAEGFVLDEKLQKIEIVGENNLSGSYTYNLDNIDAGLTPVSPKNRVVLKMQNQPTLGEEVTAYAVLVPGSKFGDELSFVITTDKHTVTFKARLQNFLKPGVFYDLPLNGTVLANNKAVVEEIHIPGPGPEEETANCYMINTTGEHSFWCTQIGNGDKGIIPDVGFHVTSSKINPSSAKLMWQDVENFIDASSIRIENGKVYYTANKNSGNAMIAVYSGENCTGDILWSWHIWGVGDTMPGDEEITNKAGAKFIVMNRTLGTHDANSYFATLYQWGRKDPIPNSPFYYLTDGSKVDISQNYPTFRPEKDDVSILTSVQNCDKMIYPFNWDAKPNWLNYENQHLWGDSSTRDHYTWWDSGRLSNTEAGAGWAEQKTIYDPSPVGYRVANKFTFSGFVKRDDGIAKVHGAFNEGQVEEWLYVITEPRPGQEAGHYIYWWPKFNNGFYFMRNSTDTEGTYFPNTGMRYPGGNNALVGVEGSYNYSAPNKNANLVDHFHIGKYEWRDKDNLNGAGNHCELAIQEHGEKGVARAIRCVRE